MAASEELKSALRKRRMKLTLDDVERKAYNTYIYGKIKESKKRKREAKAAAALTGAPPEKKVSKGRTPTYKKMQRIIAEYKEKFGEI